MTRSSRLLLRLSLNGCIVQDWCGLGMCIGGSMIDPYDILVNKAVAIWRYHEH